MDQSTSTESSSTNLKEGSSSSSPIPGGSNGSQVPRHHYLMAHRPSRNHILVRKLDQDLAVMRDCNEGLIIRLREVTMAVEAYRMLISQCQDCTSRFMRMSAAGMSTSSYIGGVERTAILASCDVAIAAQVLDPTISANKVPSKNVTTAKKTVSVTKTSSKPDDQAIPSGINLGEGSKLPVLPRVPLALSALVSEAATATTTTSSQATPVSTPPSSSAFTPWMRPVPTCPRSETAPPLQAGPPASAEGTAAFEATAAAPVAQAYQHGGYYQPSTDQSSAYYSGSGYYNYPVYQ